MPVTLKILIFIPISKLINISRYGVMLICLCFLVMLNVVKTDPKLALYHMGKRFIGVKYMYTLNPKLTSENDKQAIFRKQLYSSFDFQYITLYPIFTTVVTIPAKLGHTFESKATISNSYRQSFSR